MLSGRLKTGRLARLAVWRHVDDLKHAGERGFYFDDSFASEFLDFSELCVHTQGEWAGKQFISEPWQKFCDWNLFGWRRKSDGLRRFRSSLEEIGRKNGKTTRCSPKCFALPLFDNPIEMGAQGYCVATKEDQAKLLFEEIKRCAKLSPSLRNHVELFQKRIVFPSTQSYMQVLGSDSDSQDGFNPHFIVRDELHAWRERHRGLASKLDTGFGARRQPLMMTITTAGDDDSCIWQEDHDYAVRVVESVITGEIVDDTLFAFMCAIDVKESPCFRCLGDHCPWCDGTGTIPIDDPFDESCWIKANPNLGVSCKLDYLRLQANKAKNKPTDRNNFLRYHCNVKVSSSERAIDPETWSQCKGELSDWSTADDIHGGIDLGRAEDFASIGVVASFRETDDSGSDFIRYELKSRSFTSEKRRDGTKTEQMSRWIREGILTASSGDSVDPSEVQDEVLAIAAEFSPKTWAYDPTFAHQMGLSLSNEHGLTVFKFTQGPRHYNEAIRRFVSLASETRTVNGIPVRMITHDGCPCLAWQITNLIIKRNYRDEWMPDKSNSANKIDAAVALLMAFSECLYAEKEGAFESYYDDESAVVEVF